MSRDYLAAYRRRRENRVRLADERQSSYGFPLTDDPRRFEPDPECATVHEVERWARHCEDAESGRALSPDEGSVQTCSMGGSAPWGLGTTYATAIDWRRVLERLRGGTGT